MELLGIDDFMGQLLDDILAGAKMYYTIDDEDNVLLYLHPDEKYFIGYANTIIESTSHCTILNKQGTNRIDLSYQVYPLLLLLRGITVFSNIEECFTSSNSVSAEIANYIFVRIDNNITSE